MTKKIIATAGKLMATGRATLSVHGPLPAEHPLYATIGLVTAEWSQMEHILDLIIWELADVRHEIGSCITGQMMGHAPRFKAIQALALLTGLDKVLLDRIESLSNQTSGLAAERNRIVHDAWYFEHASGQLGQFKSPSHKSRNFGFKDIDMTTIDATLQKIRTKLTQVHRLRSDILNARHT
jgi:hypothetical protein